MIGYGGMLTEGALAVLALLAVAAGLSWGELDRMVVQPGGAGAIVAFGTGFGVFTAPLVGASFGLFFGITMINAFVMTTLDTTVRLSRFLVGEMGGERFPLLRNRWVASLAAVVPAFLLVVTGGQNVLWPMFAAANQLVAGLTLIVLSAWLVGMKRPVWYTLGPAIVMLLTTMAALVWQGWRFLVAYDPAKGPNRLLGGLAAVLLVLAVVVAYDAAAVLRRKARPVSAGTS
jgi:carbon starvation protein